MVISHKYRFIFVKTGKTAGTSIEVFLSQCCGAQDVFTPIWPQVEPHRARNYQGFWNPFLEIKGSNRKAVGRTMKQLVERKKFYSHIPASIIRCRVGDRVWNRYFKFCVERNPWDKTLSHYHMMNHRAGGNISLDEYIEKGSFCMNFHRYTTSGGELLVDEVVKYESLMEGLGPVFKRLGVPFNGSLGVNAKAEYRHDRTPYQEVLSARQGRIIEQAFSKEIRMHGYAF